MNKLEIYQDLKENILTCKSCDLGCSKIDGQDPHVAGQGNLNALVMFVAEAPGEQETIHKRPLTPPGVSGKLYEKVLTYLGLTRDDVYTTNTVACLNGKSKVKTEDGWKQIDNIVKHQYNGNVYCVDENGTEKTAKIVNWFKNDRNGRKLFKVHLHNARKNSKGYTGAILTEDHPILTINGYKQVKNLLKNDLIHSGTYQPSSDVIQALIGMLLGDATIDTTNSNFAVSHTESQIEYLKHIKSILNINKKLYKYSGKKNNIYRLNMSVSPFMRKLNKEWYKDSQKIVTKENLKQFGIISLAYLFMDDGYMRFRKNKAPLAEIATCNFSQIENQLISKKIKKLGIDSYIRKTGKYYRIFFDAYNTKILSEKISPYIHNSMNYKILPEHRNIKKNKINLKEDVFYDTFYIIRYKKEEKISNYVYCIEVEHYNNFMTHSGIVHNCHPPDNRDPELWELKKCREHLNKQIALVQPKLVVTFGRFAAQAFVNNIKITKDHGKIIKSAHYEVNIFPLVHPAYVQAYAPQSQREAFKKDIKVLKKMIEQLKKENE